MSLLLDALKNAENAKNDKGDEANEEFVASFDSEELKHDIIPPLDPVDLAQAATEADPKNIVQEPALELKDSITVGAPTLDNAGSSEQIVDHTSDSPVIVTDKHSISPEEELPEKEKEEKEEKDLQRRKNDQKNSQIESKEKSLQWDLPSEGEGEADAASIKPVEEPESITAGQVVNEPLRIIEQKTECKPEFFHFAKPLNNTNRNRILLIIFVLIGTVAGSILLYILNQTGAQRPLFSNPVTTSPKNTISQATPKATILTSDPVTTSHEKSVTKTLAQINKVRTVEEKPVKHIHATPHDSSSNDSKRLSSLDPTTPASTNPLDSHEAQVINLDGKEIATGAFKETRESLKLNNIIKIVKHKTSEANNSRVLQAYRLYQNGQLGKAQHLYQLTLKNNDKNRDAILGLAAIAVHRNQGSRAMSYYKALLSLDPKDNVALTGLLSLSRKNNRTQTISIIKQLIIEKPSANLFFLLGNLYSANKSWPEAQGSYFEAWNRDNTRPDYAYNLAVSLDSLNQRSSALRYYRIALKLSKSKIARYDRNALKQRIRDLSRQYKSGRKR